MIDVSDKTAQDKFKKYHYSNPDQEIIAKEDDHYPDALIAWAASRWKIVGTVLKNYEKLVENEKAMKEIQIKRQLRNMK